jgi:hypothetical protein
LAGLTLSGRSFNGSFMHGSGGPISPKNDSNMGSNGDLSIKNEPSAAPPQQQQQQQPPHHGHPHHHHQNGSSTNGAGNSSMPSSSAASSSSSSSANGHPSSSSSFVPQLAFGNLYIQSEIKL